MNTIIYNNKTYSREIVSINPYQSNSMVADTLESDVMEVVLNVSDPTELIPYTYGDVVEYDHNDELVGKFRLSSIERIAKTQYRLTCTSVIGIMQHIKHYGGKYSTQLGNIIREIFTTAGMVEDVDYSIDNKVSNIFTTGALPIASCRDNLKQCLFSCGASLTKDDEGKINIFFNAPVDYQEIVPQRIYEGGSFEYPSLATKVTILEHEYKATNLDEVVQLYETADVVEEKIVTFSELCYNIEWTGSELIYPTSLTQGTNYAIVSGAGVLTGKKYTHTTNEISVETGVEGEAYELQVTDMTLVSVLNSKNCAERIASYYANAQIIGTSFVLDHERPMDRVMITDPYDEVRIGYIKELDIKASNTVKADAKIVTNWSPRYIGNDFNNYAIFKISDLEEGKITLPADAVGSKGKFILFSGFRGGKGGYDGESGGDPTDPFTYDDLWNPNTGQVIAKAKGCRTGGKGGAGGEGGLGGQGFKIAQIDVDVLEATYDASIGIGGVGGARNGSEGSIGGDTSITVDEDIITTQGKQVTNTPIANALNGDVYGDIGVNGIAGGYGGNGGRVLNASSLDYRNASGSEYGQGVTDGETIWYGMEPSQRLNVSYAYSTYKTAGCAGAGSAVGSSGIRGAGDSAISSSTHPQMILGYNYGANATAPQKAEHGKCGRGGNGGGGGAGRSAYSVGWRVEIQEPTITMAGSVRGGQGSVGGQGSDGFILLYYN